MNGELMSAESTAIAALNRSEIDSQISTARAYPRDEKSSLAKAAKLALMSEDVAAEMFYVLKRGTNKITGPSIRLAEVVAATWGNIRFGSRVIDIGDRMLTAQGMCHDLETNVCMTSSVERRITTKDGKRYGDDMLQTTGMAACAIAERNAIFKVIPKGLLVPIYEKAMRVAAGDVNTIQDRWNGAVAHWSRHNITEEQLMEYLKVSDPAKLTNENIADLIGLWNAVKSGEESIEAAFNIQVQTREGAKKKASRSAAADLLGPTLPNHLSHLKSLLDECKTMDDVMAICDSKVTDPDDLEEVGAYGKFVVGES